MTVYVVVDVRQSRDRTEITAALAQVCRELMKAEAVGNTCFFLMCSPQTPHGPANW
jgi:hypothetical protein